MGLAEDFDGELDQILADEEARKKPGLGGQLLQGVHNVLGAPAKFTNDIIKDYVSGATGTKMPEDFSAPRALASGLGLYQGDEGYTGTIARKGLETAAQVAWDPVTYAAFGLSGPAAKVATPVFGALATEGMFEAGGRAYEGWKKDGFTPQVAGDVFDTALQGAMAGAATAHMAEKPLVASRILTETPEVLNKRLERYRAAGKTELYDMVQGEIDKRQAQVDELVNADQAKRDEVINNARQRGGYTMGADKIAGIVDRVRNQEITPEQGDRLLRRLDRTYTKAEREITPEVEALAGKQAELLQGQPNPFGPDAQQLPMEGAPVEPVQTPLREPAVDTTNEYEEVPLTGLDVNTQKPRADVPLDQILKHNPMSDVPNTAEPGLGSIEERQAKVNEDIKIAQSPEEIFSMLDRLEQKAQAPAKPRLILADVTPPPKEAPVANIGDPLNNQPVGSLGEVQAPTAPLPGGDQGGMVNPEGPVTPGPGLPGSVAVPDNRPGPGPKQLQPTGDFRGVEDRFAGVKAVTKGYVPEEFLPTPEAPKPATPDRRAKIQRGMNGSVDVEFPDALHKELFAAEGRSRRQTRGEGGLSPNWQWLADNFGVDRNTIGEMARDYKKQVMEGVKGLEADSTFQAPKAEIPIKEAPVTAVEPKPTKAKPKRGPKPTPVPDEPPKGAEPTHTVGGNPVIILGEVPEGTGLKGETVKIWDPKVKDWSYARPEDLKPITRTASDFPKAELDKLVGEAYQDRLEVLRDHAAGKISDVEKEQRLENIKENAREAVQRSRVADSVEGKTNKEDLARMEGDERVQTVKQAFQAHVDELSKVAGEAGHYDPMLQRTEVTNLRHGQDLAANTSQTGFLNTLGVNLPRIVDNFLHRMNEEGVPRDQFPEHFQAELRRLAGHETAHSALDAMHEGDVVWDPERGDWGQTLTNEGKRGGIVPIEGELGPQSNMQYHTLTEENLRREAASRPTPYADSLLTEAAKPYVDKVWADAQSAANELRRLNAPDLKKPIRRGYTTVMSDTPKEMSATPSKPKRPQTAKQAQNQAIKQNATIDEVQKKLKAAGHLTQAQIDDLGKLIRKDPSKADAIKRIAEKPTLWGKINEGWKMGLISGPSTWVVKGVTDAGEMVFRVGETAVAPLVDKLLPGPRTRFESETRARVEGSLSKLSEASAKFAQDMRDAFTVAPEKIDLTRPVELQVGKIGGTKGTFIRTPGRVLNAITDFFRTTEAAGELRRMARQEAEKLGGGATAVKQMSEQIYKEALDPTNPKWQKLLKASNDAAAEQVFQSNNPGPLLKSLMELRRKNPWLHAVLPFLEVPGNITKMIAQRTPLGFVKGAKAYRAFSEALKSGAKPEVVADLKGKAVDALTRPILGTAVIGAFGAYALGGGMTGGGPSDQKKKNEMLQAGWQPYSFKVGKTYVPYHRFEPAGSLLGIAADIAESRHSKSAEEFFDKGLHSFGENFTNQSYMQSVADAMQFISDPKTAIKTYATSMAGSVVPNIVRRGAQALDPTVRDVKPRGAKLTDLPELMGRSVVAGLPGLSRMLPAKMSDTGEPIKRPGVAVTRFASPVQPSWENDDTAVLNHMASVDFAPGVPAKSMKINGVDVEMTEKEYAQVAGANRRAIDYVKDNYLNNSRFTGLPADKQKIYIQRIFNRFRDEAKGQVQSSSDFKNRLREGMSHAQSR